MTAKKCFMGKIAAGRVSARAGAKLLALIDAFEAEYKPKLGDEAGARQAAIDAALAAERMTNRRADLVNRTIIAQTRILKIFKAYDDTVNGLAPNRRPVTLGLTGPRHLGGGGSTLFQAMRSLLMRDPHEIATWQNVDKLAQDIRGRAHARFAEAIELLRPKKLGLKAETAAELDVLRGLYGAEASADAAAAARAFEAVAEDLADQFIAAGGALAKRKDWRLPNPEIDPAKARAIGAERLQALFRAHVDRDAMIDWETGLRMSDATFEAILAEAADGFINGFDRPLPSAAVKARRMLANSRDLPRVFVWKSAESWLAIAEAVGAHQSPYETMLDHIAGMADDIAMMRVLGPNPEATKRFILDLFAREAARLAREAAAGEKVRPAVRANEKIESAVRRDRQNFENAWAETTGLNNVPVSSEFARVMSDTRSVLAGSQMGSAIISSITDVGTTAMAARFNGIPAANVLARATKMMTEPGAEIFAAQTGLVADAIARSLSKLDRAMGETIRTGRLAKVGSTVIRASGLRRWTATLRNAFGLEMMAHVARERGKGFAALDKTFRNALGRYGIGAEDWELIRTAPPFEPRPQALFIRPVDVATPATPAARAASEKLARLINTEIDYAVIEADPVARALLIGDTRPGSAKGEFWRAAGMYKMFPTAFMTMHFARAFARGVDGGRLGHGALTFAAVTLLGALAMQAKQVNAGRDPYSLDPTTGDGLRSWGAAILQGGGLGIFGDMLFVDKTRYNNSWATILTGPQFAAAEGVLGDFLLKNLRLAARGEETHFLGDALYVAARYVPGSNLWYGKLAFQRAVLDQLALMIDERAPERFRRIERAAARSWGQDYWWRPGRPAPERAPASIIGP